MSKVINADEAIEILQKERNGHELTDIERHKLDKLLTIINTQLANYEEDLIEFKKRIFQLSNGRQTLAVQACIEYALNYIINKIDIKVTDEDMGDTILTVYNEIRNNKLDVIIEDITKEGE